MEFSFLCPQCNIANSVKGSAVAAWRYRLACDGCAVDVVITWDGALHVAVGEDAAPFEGSNDRTVQITLGELQAASLKRDT